MGGAYRNSLSWRDMPPKRRKFESTFPAARIKKIMQLDDDVGRVASSVPIVISRAVEIFLQAMLRKSSDYATSRNAKTLTVGHIKHCIENEKQWDFLKDLTAKVPDITACNENEGSPKRGRKRKTSDSSKPATSTTPGKKRVKKTDEDEDSQTDEESDTSSPGSSHSLTLLQKSKTNEPSPLAILQRHLSSVPLSPDATTASPTQSSVSPLTALASGLKHSTAHSDVFPSVKTTTLPTSLNATTSPLLAYASSISQPNTISEAPPLPTTEQKLSALTNLGQVGGGSGGCHDNNEDEDYDA